jgi:hypothetical protein
MLQGQLGGRTGYDFDWLAAASTTSTTRQT